MSKYDNSTCNWCGAIIPKPNKTQRAGLHRAGHAYCSTECSSANASHISSIRMAETNRKHCSARMKRNNPMKREDVRQKQLASILRAGVKPPIQGGNGRGPTKWEAMLAAATGLAVNVVVPTKVPRGTGYPTCYKIDLGDEFYKVGVEVDGNSHYGVRKVQDNKKDLFLQERGWTILRFKNKEVENNLRACVDSINSTLEKKREAETLSGICLGSNQAPVPEWSQSATP